MSTLGVDASGAKAGVAIIGEDGAVLAREFLATREGLIETLPVLVARLVAGREISAVAVGIGPGSFTGLRTSLAFAQGYAAASGIPLAGVMSAESVAAGLPGLARPLWVAIRARKNRVFLCRDGCITAMDDEAVPLPKFALAIGGDAANEITARLAARGSDVMLTDAKQIDPLWVVRAARFRAAAGLAPHESMPVYVDPPEAKQPAGGLRAAPL